MQYTIKAVSPKTREYSTKFGDFISYRLKLSDTADDTVVELSQKADSRPPQVGDILEGTIDMSAQYGPKFKKDFGGGGFGGGQSGTGSSTTARSYGSKPGVSSDPFTMYLSYAKDIAVALIGTKDGFQPDKFDSILESVIAGGKSLYDGRPGAETEGAKTPDESKKGDEVVDLEDTPEKIMGVEEGSKPVDVSEIPF